jgi:hypothetical protein
MRCETFDPRAFAEDLMIEAWWANRYGGAGIGVVEAYCHHETCPEDERRFLEYVATSRDMKPEDLYFVQKGLESMASLTGTLFEPHP